jgi:hypothetical protein
VRSSGYWFGATLALLAELGSLAALAFWGFTVTKVAVQGGAVAALAVAGRPWLAVALGLAAAIGQLLTVTLSPPAAGPTRSGRGPRRAGGSPTG